MKTLRSFVFLSMVLGVASGYGRQDSASTGRPRIEEAVISTPAGTSATFDSVCDMLSRLRADENMVGRAENVALAREGARFTLADGTLYLCSPVRERVWCALFEGKGSISFVPPEGIERSQLERFYETDTLVRDFSSLFLFFADTTLAELKSKVPLGKGSVPSGVDRDLAYCGTYLWDIDRKYVKGEIATAILEGAENSLFYAQFSSERFEPMAFEVNPYQFEEVRLLRKNAQAAGYHLLETVNQFPARAISAANHTAAEDDKSILITDSVVIDCRIEDNLDLSACARIRFHFVSTPHEWIHYSLSEKLLVDSVLDSRGRPLEFSKGKENSSLWVRERAWPEGESERTVSIFYHGKKLERVMDLVYLGPSIDWYPQYDVRQKAYFDLTFRTPDKFTFASVGVLVSSDKEHGTVVSHWRPAVPIRNASFNIGYFDRKVVDDGRIPPVTVLMSSSKGGMLDQVASDVANSIEFYQSVYGKSPMGELIATEIPSFHGEAFPGLIHLSSETFQRTGEKGYDEIFRAHEVAHQWWGIGVDYRTYHDQWLSEAFAEYSGLWYMQTALKDNDKFFTILDDYAKAIIGNRKFIFGTGQEAGPVWLGYRTSSASTVNDYSLIVYRKGAWVIHMLRNLLLDLQTMKEDRFKRIMQNYYQSYLGKRASTEDFKKVVEQEAGIPMDWFFKEWIYDTRIPKYTFASRVDQQTGGGFHVSCKVRQEGVADDFQMIVPLLVDYGGGKHSRFRAVVKGPLSQFDLPILPMEPKKIVFNDLHSVLCEVEYAEWK